MTTGLLVGAAVVVLQVALLLAYARRFPDPAWHLPLVAALVAAPFLGALAAVDSEDAALGLVTAQVALIAFGPEIASRTGSARPPAGQARRAGRLLRAVQLLLAVLAVETAIRHDDWLGAAPAAVAVLALERCVRHISP